MTKQHARTSLLYTGAIGASAALLFAVQPMFARLALPRLGGAPAVWAVSLVFFQAALLIGYLYAHGLTRLQNLRRERLVHLAVLASAGLTLPVSLTNLLGSPTESAPIPWLLAVLTVSVGAPFAALSATAPLLQSWYARSTQPDAANPYRLYVASNIGSLLSLVAYPIVIEPLIGLKTQTTIWSACYLLVAAAVLACVTVTLRPGHRAASAPLLHAGTAAPPTMTQRLRWTFLAAIPSGLLIAVTNYITTDIAAAPFLWAPPLIIYLVTFIIAFSDRPLIRRDTTARVLALLAPGMMAFFFILSMPMIYAVPVHLTVLFIASLACHQALSDERPSARFLTDFYLHLSAGGVLGGLSCALIAPLLFHRMIEYPWLLILSCLAIVPLQPQLSARDRLITLAICALPLTLVVLTKFLTWDVSLRLPLYSALLAGFVALRLRDRPIVFTVACALVMATGSMLDLGRPLYLARSFFGVAKVIDDPPTGIRRFLHGTTLHGLQSLDPSRATRPLGYYYLDSPMGQAVQALRNSRGPIKIGVIGLGAGASACWVNPGDRLDFFEIDPLIVKIASNPRYFTYLSRCNPGGRIVLGDARLMLEREPDASYDLLVIDAFSSDSIPAHLITLEAVQGYFRKTTPRGIVVFHVSNRHLRLDHVLANIAAQEELSIRFRVDSPSADQILAGTFPSHVAVLARSETDLSPVLEHKAWLPVQPNDARVWTDDYTNLVGALIAKLRSDE